MPPAARSPGGSLIRLAEQDRRLWDRDLIAEGQAIVRACVKRGRPGPYQVQAAISAVHSLASSIEETDWAAILTLYDQLYALTPTPVVALNRAVALAEVRGPATGLAAVDDVRSPALDGYYLFHAARADLLRRLGREEEAAAAYAAARSQCASVRSSLDPRSMRRPTSTSPAQPTKTREPPAMCNANVA